jgi:hypothetical protein
MVVIPDWPARQFTIRYREDRPMAPPKLSLSGSGWVNGITHHNSPNQNGGMAVPSGVLGVVMHTMVGNLPGADGWFMNPAAQVSAHFGIAQDGTIIQWVNVRGGIAWHCADGNPNWYGIEHADNGNPGNPLTTAQLNASAQLVELLSRDDVGRFPLAVCNTTAGLGYGVHYMGGAAWGGHSCPQLANGTGPRSGQRADIIAIAHQIRSGTTAPPSAAALLPVEETVLVTFGSDGKAALPLPANVVGLRLACSQGAKIGIDWIGAGVPQTTADLTGNRRVDITIPRSQTGQVILTQESADGPVYAVWIQRVVA